MKTEDIAVMGKEIEGLKEKNKEQNERIRGLELMVENLLKRVEQLESSGLFI